MSMARVVLIRCTSYDPDELETAIRRGIDLLGGVERFVREGELREVWQYDDGSWDSLVYLSMLEREWAERRGVSPR